MHAMGAQTARRWLVGCVPKSRLPRWLGLTRAPCSFLSHPDDRQEGAGEAPPIPSDWCSRLDRRREALTIPISAAIEALQSNEAYSPRMRQRWARRFRRGK